MVRVRVRKHMNMHHIQTSSTGIYLDLLHDTPPKNMHNLSPMTPNKTIQPAHHGIPVGIVKIPVTKIQTFRNLLDKTLNTKTRFRSVLISESKERTIHLPANVCAALDDKHPVLVEFLESVGGVYTPGVRRSNNGDTGRVVYKKRKIVSEDAFTFVELFAGIGGFRVGLEEIGGKCMYASEINPQAASIYQKNFDDNILDVGDILDLNTSILKKYTMLTAGFPCQPFTSRGERNGLKDDRGQMYRECARVLFDTKPDCFLFENVIGLVTMEGGSRPSREKGTCEFVPGRVFTHIIDAFTKCGYQVYWQVINSRCFVPQYRERVYIVGIRDDVKHHVINWENVISQAGEAIHSTVRSIMEPKESTWCMRSELKSSQWNKVQSTHNKRNRDPYEESRINLDGKAPTIISNYHRVGSLSTKFIHEQRDGTVCDGRDSNRNPRFLTPRECASIMGFPRSYIVPEWSDSQDCVAHFYQGIGNAVTPPVISAIGKEMFRCMEKDK